jgi:hypothetical protein
VIIQISGVFLIEVMESKIDKTGLEGLETCR